MSSEFVSISAAAKTLAVNEKTIRRWISHGLIKAVRIGPRLIRVDLSSLELHPLGPGQAEISVGKLTADGRIG